MFKYKIQDNPATTNIQVTLEEDGHPADKITVEADTLPDLVILITEIIDICSKLKAIANNRRI